MSSSRRFSGRLSGFFSWGISISKKRVAKNFLSGSTIQIASQIIWLFVVIYLARALGPSSYGTFSVAIATMAYFALAMTFGLPTIGIRKVARDNAVALQTWWDIAVLRLLLSAISYSLLVILALMIPAFRDIRILLILYGTNMFIMALQPDWTFIGLERMAWLGFARVLGYALTLGLILVFVRNSDQATIGMIAILAGSFLIMLVLLVRLLRLGGGRSDLAVPKERLRKLFREAFPFFFSALSSQLFGNADLILLGLIKGKTEAGIYAAGYKIINLLDILIGLISQATYPAMARLFQSDHERSRTFAGAITAVMLAVFLPIAMGGTVVATHLVHLLYGDAYAATAKPFAILLWYIALSAVCISFSNVLLAVNEDRPFVIAITGGSILDLALIAFMVPKWSATGAAVAMVVSELFILAYIGFHAYRKKLVVLPLRSFVPILISTLVMTAGIWLLREHLEVVVIIIFAALIYGIVLALGFFFIYKSPAKKAE